LLSGYGGGLERYVNIYIYIEREREIRGAELAFRMNMENTRFPILAKKKRRGKLFFSYFIIS
jgi:hypothetical protein